jgi:hypothetical protein
VIPASNASLMVTVDFISDYNTVASGINATVLFTPTYCPFTGHYYSYVPTSTTWIGAMEGAAVSSMAGAPGWWGHLVSVSSPEENACVAQALLVSRLSSVTSWIAGSNAFFPGNRTAQSFAWLAGPELAQPLAAADTNFAAGEPNNAGGAESCLTFKADDKKWYDSNCLSTYGYMIEYEAFTASWPSATTHVPAGSSAYQLLETPVTFAIAIALAPPAPFRKHTASPCPVPAFCCRILS